jgi:REP element-mobilizing transposase RayT
MYVNVMSIWMEDDHVHMYISIPVSKSIPYVVQRLKWVTSKEIMKEYKSYLKRWYWSEESTLRARWYFVCTVWEITSEVVKNYVDAQWKEDVLWIEVEL